MEVKNLDEDLERIATPTVVYAGAAAMGLLGFFLLVQALQNIIFIEWLWQRLSG